MRDDMSLIATVERSFSPAEQKRLAYIMAQRYPPINGVENECSRVILHTVAWAYDCSIENILGSSRTFVAARAAAAVLLHDKHMGGFSYSEVGQILRPTRPMHHTSVMYLVERVTFDDRWSLAVHRVEQVLGQSNGTDSRRSPA